MPSRLSTVYWKVPVAGTVNGVAVDVSTDSVYLALFTDNNAIPDTGDWKPASWETTSSGYAARILVGPVGGAVDFSTVTVPVDVHVWVKVTDSPEVPVLYAGTVHVT